MLFFLLASSSSLLLVLGERRGGGEAGGEGLRARGRGLESVRTWPLLSSAIPYFRPRAPGRWSGIVTRVWRKVMRQTPGNTRRASACLNVSRRVSACLRILWRASRVSPRADLSLVALAVSSRPHGSTYSILVTERIKCSSWKERPEKQNQQRNNSVENKYR